TMPPTSAFTHKDGSMETDASRTKRTRDDSTMTAASPQGEGIKNSGAGDAELDIDAFLRGRCRLSRGEKDDVNRSEQKKRKRYTSTYLPVSNEDDSSAQQSGNHDMSADNLIHSKMEPETNFTAMIKRDENRAAATATEPYSGAPTDSPSLDGDDLLPEYGSKKNGKTPYGRIRSCMCPNPMLCRDIMWRWVRIKEAKCVYSHRLPPRFRKSNGGRKAVEHVNAYRLAVLRSLGYSIKEDGTISRTKLHGEQESTTDKKIFSSLISIVHFPPETWEYIMLSKEKKEKLDRWRIPLSLGEKLGLKDEDRCPAPDSNGEQSFFALPNYSIGDATRDVEKAEAQYKQKAKAYQRQNEALLRDIATDPTKAAMKIHSQEQEIAALVKTVKEMREEKRRHLAEKRALEIERERLERGLEKLARRMDKWESTQNIGDDQYAKDTYKAATGKDLSKEGRYLPGTRGKTWADPRMDRAAHVMWEDPTLSTEEALRIGGFDFPSLDQKGVWEKNVVDSDNVSVTELKRKLQKRLLKKRRELEIQAANDPEAAKEYQKRYPPVEKIEGVYGGLDLRGIPDQPLVRSDASRSGFRGVKKTTAGRYEVKMGDGTNGGNLSLGTFDTVEEAAGIYARARYLMNQQKTRKPAGSGYVDMSSDDESND
ncbi:hypothetical protein ACHAWF_005187, partial [Thalassiosira exigua]